ncbi:exopolysaccharide biosynthesis polyprenyl glycosylphosphotransferase [Flavobacterium sp.]|jgi:exopolysaccharide biosynthesis polyprenyl glycosylphosphotransferase|uniref:exopolysaccharide biosynthesis polyprenyl glycosylphosphotransferase n=1 Tax=Flavobacterium sp. TaxID=239 RepID=UPI0022C930AF|nr:exopolysaccharide biosynthesis polyprenyl glycosylphosphotransferase [Flavobacterium sp.]MCZ8169851.1 exopolysaccharide biosynthesis polyprenyl glycosylphosphotransferase [Flavobacterium sp.]MCZ8298056.1 exopolysaccharide biosynthesis polyprenyl glycosylphosphotransferase [Flavobacterium sp.]
MNSNKKIHFEISERKLLLRLFDTLLVLMVLYIISSLFDFRYFTFSKDNFIWSVVLAVYLNIFSSVFEMYNLQVASNQFQVIRSIILTTSTTVLFYLLTPIYTPVLPSNRIQIIIFFLSIFATLLLWRLFYVFFLASHRFVKKAILVCDQEQLDELISGIESVDPHYKFIAFVNSDETEADSAKTFSIRRIPSQNLEAFVRKTSISELVIATQKTDGITVNLYNQLIHLLENGIIIREYTQVYEDSTKRIPVQYVSRDFYRYFPFSRSNQNHLYLLFSRVFDVLFSVIGLLLGLVFFPLILFGNLIGNRGPLFYTQKRVGKNGEVFRIYKFRTMVKNAETNGAVFTTINDTRITAFGKFMRKTRLDEFPQFINILRGDMSIIGPRPERPVFVQQIAENMPFYETRHVVKPGLTGWAQVNYSYGDSIDDSLVKLQYDLYYIKHRSIFLDINIVIKTFSTILFYRGQ